MFSKYILDIKSNLFELLSKSIQFDNINKNRKGANLIDYANGLVPLVRTTSVYYTPNQKFLDIHYNIINLIKKSTNVNDLEFNNALVEIYNSEYSKMGYHSDQSLDLDELSYICIYSCYDNPTTKNLRTLRIKKKLDDECFDIELEHNSVVFFFSRY